MGSYCSMTDAQSLMRRISNSSRGEVVKYVSVWDSSKQVREYAFLITGDYLMSGCPAHVDMARDFARSNDRLVASAGLIAVRHDGWYFVDRYSQTLNVWADDYDEIGLSRVLGVPYVHEPASLGRE
jgi:hypothetical protein